MSPASLSNQNVPHRGTVSPEATRLKDADALFPLGLLFLLLGTGMIYFWYPATAVTLFPPPETVSPDATPISQNGVRFWGDAAHYIILSMFWLRALLILIGGAFLTGRRRYTFCIAASAVACTSFPLGTVLGFLALIKLTRPGVRELFERPGRVAETN